ncbi:hypothetical protein LY76DRAFT_601329 [Colletotrichum caudatum]|nr:hypothetical protein LY76DRAFT_601329 [Colletotrichum caudatum]
MAGLFRPLWLRVAFPSPVRVSVYAFLLSCKPASVNKVGCEKHESNDKRSDPLPCTTPTVETWRRGLTALVLGYWDDSKPSPRLRFRSVLSLYDCLTVDYRGFLESRDCSRWERGPTPL